MEPSSFEWDPYAIEIAEQDYENLRSLLFKWGYTFCLVNSAHHTYIKIGGQLCEIEISNGVYKNFVKDSYKGGDGKWKLWFEWSSAVDNLYSKLPDFLRTFALKYYENYRKPPTLDDLSDALAGYLERAFLHELVVQIMKFTDYEEWKKLEFLAWWNLMTSFIGFGVPSFPGSLAWTVGTTIASELIWDYLQSQGSSYREAYNDISEQYSSSVKALVENHFRPVLPAYIRSVREQILLVPVKLTCEVDENQPYPNQTVTLSTRLLDGVTGEGIGGRRIALRLGDKVEEGLTDENGRYSIRIQAPGTVGFYTCLVRFGGDSLYENSENRVDLWVLGGTLYDFSRARPWADAFEWAPGHPTRRAPEEAFESLGRSDDVRCAFGHLRLGSEPKR